MKSITCLKTSKSQSCFENRTEQIDSAKYVRLYYIVKLINYFIE